MSVCTTNERNLCFLFVFCSALDELEDDEDFATVGTESRTQGGEDGQGIKAMEVRFFCFSLTVDLSLCQLPLVACAVNILT